MSLKVDSTIKSKTPEFCISINQKKSGVIFKGIPNGHEFTSLIVAILNADGKGKLPDASIIKRIQSLKGPIRIRTYISLTCENCPDRISSFQSDGFFAFRFPTWNAGRSLFSDDITRLNIQGVPSVIANGSFIHSGRITLDLLAKVEAQFGFDEWASATLKAPVDLGLVDVAVIGGGPAGASAAIYSVRKGLKQRSLLNVSVGKFKTPKALKI